MTMTRLMRYAGQGGRANSRAAGRFTALLLAAAFLAAGCGVSSPSSGGGGEDTAGPTPSWSTDYTDPSGNDYEAVGLFLQPQGNYLIVANVLSPSGDPLGVAVLLVDPTGSRIETTYLETTWRWRAMRARPQLAGGGLWIAGYSPAEGSLPVSPALASVDGFGHHAWSFRYPGEEDAVAVDVAAVEQGGVLLLTHPLAGGELAVHRIAPDGSLFDTYRYTQIETANVIVEQVPGVFAIAGNEYEDGGVVLKLLQVLTNGSPLGAVSTFRDHGVLALGDMRPAFGEGLLFYGTDTSGGQGAGNLSLLRMASDNTSLWDWDYISAGDQVARRLLRLADGGWLMLATTSGDTTGTDQRVLRVDPEGVSLWQKTYAVAGEQTAADFLLIGSGQLMLLATSREDPTAASNVLLTLLTGVF